MKHINLFLNLTSALLALASFAFVKSRIKGPVNIHTAKCRTLVGLCRLWHPFLGSFVASPIKQLCFDPVNGNLGTIVTATLCLTTLKTQVAASSMH